MQGKPLTPSLQPEFTFPSCNAYYQYSLGNTYVVFLSLCHSHTLLVPLNGPACEDTSLTGTVTVLLDGDETSE